MIPHTTYPIQKNEYPLYKSNVTIIKEKLKAMMKRHIGTKLVDAIEMTRQEYNDYRGWKLPEDENGDDTGFLVEYLDGGPPNHKAHEGYISWSPTSVFINAYRPVDSMNFGLAIEALKMGKKVARSGWNGKDMFLFLLTAGTIPKSTIHDGALASVVDQVPGDTFEALATIRMWTTNSQGRKAVLTGWLASQTDMLSDDWFIVD